MRILQLDVDGHRIEFHPFVTVLRGLDVGLRERLIDAFVSISAGRPSIEGVVEAHGIVLDLTDETLKLLDLPSGEGGGFDIIVRREQLPGTARALSGSGRGQIERARAEAADRVARAEADADRGRVALDASRQAAAADDRVEQTRALRARHRLDAARSAVFDAERAVRLPEVDRVDIEAVENAHEQVLLAQERADKRMRGARAQRRLDDARAVEHEILARIGFVSYTEFVMGTSILNVDPERERRLEVARAELALAEDALSDLETDVDAEVARVGLVARRKAELESATHAEEAVGAALIDAETEASAAAQAAVDHATAALEGARRKLSLIDAQLADLDGGGSQSVLTPAGVEAVEWYLLSRVAAQRALSYAGSGPLVLDDALADLGGADLVHVLSRLERMSSAVQMIVVSEDDEVASWADSVGTDRAKTLYPLSA